jgi:hypothetical protein
MIPRHHAAPNILSVLKLHLIHKRRRQSGACGQQSAREKFTFRELPAACKRSTDSLTMRVQASSASFTVVGSRKSRKDRSIFQPVGDANYSKNDKQPYNCTRTDVLPNLCGQKGICQLEQKHRNANDPYHHISEAELHEASTVSSVATAAIIVVGRCKIVNDSGCANSVQRCSIGIN